MSIIQRKSFWISFFFKVYSIIGSYFGRWLGNYFDVPDTVKTNLKLFFFYVRVFFNIQTNFTFEKLTRSLEIIWYIYIILFKEFKLKFERISLVSESTFQITILFLAPLKYSNMLWVTQTNSFVFETFSYFLK